MIKPLDFTGSHMIYLISVSVFFDIYSFHNLSFLQDEKITDDEVYLITRARDRAELNAFGKTELVLQSQYTRREKSPLPTASALSRNCRTGSVAL